MAVLSAIFRGVDEISNTLDSMASSGEAAVQQWESAGAVASEAFARASSGATEAAQAARDAASATDYWTSAVGSYDKGALEAVYSTEELVNMGLKSQQALEDEAETARLCSQAADSLGKSIGATADIQEQLSAACDEAGRVMEELSGSEKVSAEAKEELAKASDNAARAAEELARANAEAAAANEELAQATGTAGTSQEELMQAAERATHAAEDLAEANGRATQAAEELSTATEKATEEEEKNGKTGKEAVETIEQALVAAGLTKMITETVDAVVQLGNAFSDAESIVVKATGATGEALEGLTDTMMEVYAATKDGDLNNTAGAIGEINTRLGLQGEALGDVTSNMMDYARITGTDVVGSVQNVTKIMKNWGVEVDGMEGLLDKLAYAGQASGISVDQLSNLVVTNKASLQQMGYSLDESIALLSMFEYEGLNSSSIMMGFRTAIKEFSDEGLDASAAMQNVIDQIANMSDESAATSLAVETFGTRAGPELAFAIRSGKFEIDDWTAAIQNSGGTLKTTAETATTTSEKWAQATNSVGTAFSNVLSPTVNDISTKIAEFVDGIGQFLNKHPVVTAAITALAVGLGVVVIAVVAYTAAMAVASAATTVFGAIASTALWPITLIVAGVAALVAGIALLVNIFDSANAEFNGLTATSKQQYEQLEELNDEYDRTVELYGENSEQAKALAEDIAGLEAQYEATKMTLEEFIAENDALIESHDKLIESYNTSMEDLDKEEKSTTALIGKLEQLASKTDRTAGEQQQMSAIIDKLNEQVPELALNYDDFTGSVDRSIASVKALAEAEAKKKREEAQYQGYVDLLADQADLQEQLAKATEQTAAAQERYDSASGWDQFWNVGKVKSDLEDFTAEHERLQSALDETNDKIAENEEAFEEAARATEEAARQSVDYETAVNQAVQSVADDLNELVEKYDEAYASARESIDGQIGLFDTMKTETDLSISDMKEAMQSQINYLSTYTENLQKAAQYGLDDGLIASLSDGSTESAGYINAIIENIEKLGGTTEGLSGNAAAFVEDFNGQFQQVDKAKDDFATTVAKMETDFDEKMGEIESRMGAAIDNMNMSDDAATAAHETISAYVASIKSMTDDAYTAAASVAAAAQNGLKSKGISLVGLPGFASGTLDAPDMFIAGEEGPELIVGAGGSTVFPADETSKILAAAGSTPVNTSAPDGMEVSDEEKGNSAIEKKITLEIAGSGAIDVSGPYDEERMTDLLFTNLKPVLMNLLKRDVFEEGDLAYEF